MDGEGDYEAQRYELHAETSQLLAGAVDSPQIDSVVALVQIKSCLIQMDELNAKIY